MTPCEKPPNNLPASKGSPARQEDSAQQPRATRRRSSMTSTTSWSTKGEGGGATTPPKHGKAHRRVSFTTATTMEDPPSVVVVDGDGTQQEAVNTSLESEDTWNAAACVSPSPSKRRSSLSSLQATPHHSNLNNHTSPLQTPPPNNLNSWEKRRSSLSSLQATPHHSNLNNTHSAHNTLSTHTPADTTPLQTPPPNNNLKSSYSQQLGNCHTFPQAQSNRVLSPYRVATPNRRSSMASSRRSSLDSCASGSSAISSSCFSAASLASVLSYRDETFQRTKLLTCVEWLSRHVSHHLVEQLMHQVQQQQEQSVNLSSPNKQSPRPPRRGSNRATQQRRLSASSRSNKSSLPPKRPSCSFVHCETHSSSGNSSDESDQQQQRRNQRLLKTQQSLDRLSSHDFTLDDDEDDEEVYTQEQMLALGYESAASLSSWATNNKPAPEEAAIPLPPPQSHTAALLLVDISGFTKLSTTLPLQALSQTINAYFQSIIECIQEYGGDVIKFAGDAVMAEWRIDNEEGGRTMPSRQLFAEDNNKKAASHVVQIATACACQIIERCSDYHVYDQQQQQSSPQKQDDKKLLATLNVHCGLGYGNVVGFHAGDETRREYLLLGDPIPQAGEAIALGRGGEVVASPQAFDILTSSCNVDSSGDQRPHIIFSSRGDATTAAAPSSTLLDRATLLSIPPPDKKSFHQNWTNALEHWELPALMKLQEQLSLYVHSTVIEGELFTTIYHNRATRTAVSATSSEDSDDLDDDPSLPKETTSQHDHDQRVHQSEAEIRKVFTLFLQPMVSVDITGDPVHDDAVMKKLNDVLVVANREVARFKGHLRQMIFDDKGVVLLVNFGLRGSMFPRMIENHAMPFAASLQSVLRSELNIAVHMGATYGNAYCGIVGGLERHEFSVLGPAVNLSARLMGHPENHGFLVDEGVRGEAHGWQFNAREAVRAKGYTSPVPIFEPVMHNRSPWTRPQGGFVGREEEIETILEFSDEVVSSGCSSGKMILISGASGFGKTSLLSEAVDKIQEKCLNQKRSQLILGQVCCENDLFRPMSVLGPILLDVLSKTGEDVKPVDVSEGDQETGIAIEMLHSPTGTTLCDAETAMAVQQFHSACDNADVSEEIVGTMYSLVFNHEWPEQEADSNDEMTASQRVSPAEQDEIARSIVSILLESTVSMDLVLLGIDDMSLMDELSWKVTQLWFEHACNLVVLGSSKRVTSKDINIAPSFWEYLFGTGLLLNRFLHIELPPMCEDDIQNLIAHMRGSKACEGAKTIGDSSSSEMGFAHEVYMQSGGNPRLAASMIERFAGNVDDSEEAVDDSMMLKKVALADAATLGVNEHMLHRMDAVPTVVRTHLNLCAMLGDSFSIRDVVLVMERYRGVDEPEKEEHYEFVHNTLNEAVWQGILAVEGELVHDDAVEVFPEGSIGIPQYRFTHAKWREKILELTLDSWQDDMRRLIEESQVVL